MIVEISAKTGAITELEDNSTLNEQEFLAREKARMINDKQLRLAELTKDLAQVQAGLIIEDLEERKSEFRTLLNEVRVLQGKEPRNAIDSE